jgi:CHAT domain-containing protein/tetratricopeptide (TPR) repeat protein
MLVRHLSRGGPSLALAALLIAVGVQEPRAQDQRAFVPPPRSIADITAILDQQKPDPARRAKLEAEAEAEPPKGTQGATLARFYYARAQARAELGRTKGAIADCEQAIALGGDYVQEVSRYESLLENQLRTSGEYRRAITVLERMAGRLNAPGSKGRMFSIDQRLIINHLFLGEFSKAEFYLKRNQARLTESKSWPNVDQYRSSWESLVENSKARIAEARGRHREAELAYAKAATLWQDSMQRSKSWPNPPSHSSQVETLNWMIAHRGRAKARQGKLAEAEVDVRQALLNRLKLAGKYTPDTANLVLLLGHVLSEQGRFQENERLVNTALEIFEAIGYPPDAQPVVAARANLAGAYFSMRQYRKAKAQHDANEALIKDWEPARSARFRLTWSRIATLYFTGEVEKGIRLARELVARVRERKGDKHPDTAMARAILAAGLAYARRDEEAANEFGAAMPMLISIGQEADDEDATTKLAADQRLQHLVEANLVLLARMPDRAAAAIESFRLGESIRGRTVQNAIAASAARSAARTPALADLARKEQDLDKQIAAEAGLLNNMLGLSPEERDDALVREHQAALDKLRAERTAAKREIERRFPDYASLVAPKPVTVDEIRTALGLDEALLSFHFGRRTSFVWVVSKSGPVAFADLQVTAADVESKIKALRAALEPNAETLADIPPFDVAAAHELFTLLLKPVEEGWRPAKNLFVVTNGALGLLPLSLLPTAPSTAEAGSGPAFAEYRKVPWLMRTHAVTMLPAASSLRTLRHLPPPAGKREQMIGFGDPYFNPEQASEEQPPERVRVADVGTRGIRIRLRAAPQTDGSNSAGIGQLPRLPDTADELRSIAVALDADPAKVLHLGKDANERTVKGLDLSRFRIVAFATHGLVPGEVDGLTQPALALSAPNVADVDGDGLLTMEEILGLKLNADWVLLSACNTGAGAGAGADAASGLGRAFFYAGTRALLVTNWSVHSASARELVTDLFRRQARDPKLSRAEALRQAMMALLDGEGFVDEKGKTLFTYAHPLFWAPYSIIGDGGAG